MGFIYIPYHIMYMICVHTIATMYMKMPKMGISAKINYQTI